MSEIVKVEDWIPSSKDNIVKYDGKVLVIPFDKYFNQSGDMLNIFVIKREAYTNELPVICKYINYFIKFYDTDDELLMGYLRMKFLIDTRKKVFNKHKHFISMMYDTIMTKSVIEKIDKMVEDNYDINVESSNSKAVYAEELKYTNEHAKILLKISTGMKFLVPIIFHYINSKKIEKEESILFKCYSNLFTIFGELEDGTNIYDKLYMTVLSRVKSNVNQNKGSWYQHEILGDDPVTYTDELLKERFICGVMFKYIFSKNIISLNSKVLDRQLIFFLKQKYTHDLREVSHIVDNDGLSNIDKMEMSSAKLDESMVIMSSVNIKHSMKRILKQMRCEISKEEIKYYKKHYKINKFQSQLVLYFYAKYFGGFRDLHLLNETQYITLLILLKKRLQVFGNIYLPQLLSGNIQSRLSTRTIQNNKFVSKVENSDLYQKLVDDKFSTVGEIGKPRLILNMMSILLNTTFTFVDYDNPELLGEKIEVNPDTLCDEFLTFLNQI